MMINNKKSLGIYIHIPFCRQKCRYCDFLSFINSDAAQESAYIEALIAEIAYWSKNVHEYEVDSVFIGGGTPSLLSHEHIKAIMKSIIKSFNLSHEAEITIEANPNSLSLEKALIWKDIGINRVSIGIQSFDEDVLKVLGRIHSPSEALDAYENVRKAKFHNVNIDLMFGIPSQTKAAVKNSVKEALTLNPEHISFYSLQIEEDTPIYRDYSKGLLPILDEDNIKDTYFSIVKTLKKENHHHYEISNFAKKGKESLHNTKYWKYNSYIGIGAGACSFFENKRFNNERNITYYINHLKNTGEPYLYYDEFSLIDEMNVFLFTGLRMLEGINFKAFKDSFGTDFEKAFNKNIAAIQKLKDSGSINIENNCLKINPEYIYNSNSIISAIML